MLEKARVRGQKRNVSKNPDTSRPPDAQMIVMRSLRESYTAWCERCCDVVAALDFDSAAATMEIGSAALDDLLAADKLHLVEPDAKSPLICGNSIPSN